MKNCAIVCEYNPFHTGHKYQIETAKRKTDADIICVMSGQFVQSGLPAFCDKAVRAQCAVMGGAAAVIELPTVFATASAQYFAEGALKIIAGIKDIKYIAMGAVDDGDEILRIADLKISRSDAFKKKLRAAQSGGMSYNGSTATALASLYGEVYPDKPTVEHVFSDPNNILCIEYICAINKFAPSITPIIIDRAGAKHNDITADAEYVSATAIRTAEKNGDFDRVEKYIPYLADAIRAERKIHSPDIDAYKKMCMFGLKSTPLAEINEMRNCSEGLEYLLKNMSGNSSFDAYIECASGKRYPKKRIYRLFADIVLGIKREYLDYNFITRLLACKKDFDFSVLPSIVKTNNADIKHAAATDKQVEQVLSVDEKAVALYNTLCNIDGDYYNYSLVKA